MDWPHQCAALIPCFNEAPNIGEVVRAARRVLPSVIVVDDGSTDKSGRIARRAGAEVVALAHNSGKGAALRAGWQSARARSFAWVMMLDGDGQHCPADIPDFFRCVERTGARLVIGRRNFDEIPPLRRMVNRFMSRQISGLTGSAVPDSQCGFRLAELEPLATAADHFEIESEVLVGFLLAGLRVDFVPVQTLYEKGTSKIRPFVDTYRWLRWRAIGARVSRLAQPASG